MIFFPIGQIVLL